MAHYLNEYADIQLDTLLSTNNRTGLSGGSAMSGENGMSHKTILLAARICALFGILFGILASIRSPWMIRIVVLCFLGSWYYSAKPIALVSTVWGELTKSIIVALFINKFLGDIPVCAGNYIKFVEKTFISRDHGQGLITRRYRRQPINRAPQSNKNWMYSSSCD